MCIYVYIYIYIALSSSLHHPDPIRPSACTQLEGPLRGSRNHAGIVGYSCGVNCSC